MVLHALQGAKVANQMRLPNRLLLASLGVLFSAAACTLITDVDRSKIPDGTGGVPSNGGDNTIPLGGQPEGGQNNGGTMMGGKAGGGTGGMLPTGGGGMDMGGDTGTAGMAGADTGGQQNGGAAGTPNAGAGGN
jgi:hypothetical protein